MKKVIILSVVISLIYMLFEYLSRGYFAWGAEIMMPMLVACHFCIKKEIEMLEESDNEELQ